MAVFIEKGDAPLSVRQATNRAKHILELELAQAGARAEDRELLRVLPTASYSARLSAILAALGVATYADYAAGWETDNETNTANNIFNHQLAGYRRAVARLARYRVADGRPSVTEEVDGETVVLQAAIDPLDPTVEMPVLNEAGEQTGIEYVANPLIAADDAERAEAQAVIDATPQEVKDFA